MKRILGLAGDKASLYKPDGTSVGTFSDKVVIPDDGASVNPLADLETDVPTPRVSQWFLSRGHASGALSNSGEFTLGGIGGALGSFLFAVDVNHIGERELKTAANNASSVTSVCGGGNLFFLSATSHMYEYGGVVSIPIISDGTETTSYEYGLSDVNGLNAIANGGWFSGDSNTNTKWQCLTRTGGTTTTTTTGVTVTAGQRYRLRVRSTNNTKVEFWIALDGSAFSDTPDATHTTNIPSGSGAPICGRSRVMKTAGTLVRSHVLWFETCHQLVNAA